MKTILIVEDALTMRRWLAHQFRAAFPGCVVREATNCAEALADVQRARPDLICLDLGLPRTAEDAEPPTPEAGLQLLEQIKQRPNGTRVIVVTNYDCEADALARQADGFVKKGVGDMWEQLRRYV
jgi:CheY-like chemotaxis protein